MIWCFCVFWHLFVCWTLFPLVKPLVSVLQPDSDWKWLWRGFWVILWEPQKKNGPGIYAAFSWAQLWFNCFIAYRSETSNTHHPSIQICLCSFVPFFIYFMDPSIFDIELAWFVQTAQHTTRNRWFLEASKVIFGHQTDGPTPSQLLVVAGVAWSSRGRGVVTVTVGMSTSHRLNVWHMYQNWSQEWPTMTQKCRSTMVNIPYTWIAYDWDFKIFRANPDNWHSEVIVLEYCPAEGHDLDAREQCLFGPVLREWWLASPRQGWWAYMMAHVSLLLWQTNVKPLDI